MSQALLASNSIEEFALSLLFAQVMFGLKFFLAIFSGGDCGSNSDFR